MKYAVYGVNRVMKDFLYFFDDIEVTIFFDDEESEESGLSVIDINKYDYYKDKFEQLIVCGFEIKDKLEKLDEMKLVYKEDYIKERDFFSKLDSFQINPCNKPVYVWGIGIRATKFLNINKRFEIKGFIDSFGKEEFFCNKQVVRPDNIKCWKDIYVIIAVSDDEEIKKYLNEKGLCEYIDFCNSFDISNSVAGMLERTMFDKAHYDLSCVTMLNHVEVIPEGDIYCCCTTIADARIGRINPDIFDDIWKSHMHKVLCLSNVNHTYTFCKKEMCPFFINKECQNIDNTAIDISKPYKRMEAHPKVAAIGYDFSCNLRCETCRDEFRIAHGDGLRKSMELSNIVKDSILPYCDFFILAGDGEVFVSKAYKELYKSTEMNDLKYIRILSNGTLFNEKNWEEFKQNKKGKIMLTVSVDAASKETYEAIRRGGNFDILKKNMEFASKLRKSGELAYFRMNFVVQKRNYKEIIPFIKWGLELVADEVFFTKILNWGTFSKEEFQFVSMMEEDGITPKKELEDVLNHPIINNKIVDLGTIRYAHIEVRDKEIENYYMWELERKVPNLFTENI